MSLSKKYFWQFQKKFQIGSSICPKPLTEMLDSEKCDFFVLNKFPVLDIDVEMKRLFENVI